jgi:hypothetical protein
MQKQLALLAEMRTKLRVIEDHIIALCATEQAAFRMCINKAEPAMTQGTIASKLKIAKGDFNTILNSDQNKRVRNLSRTNQIHLQQICQNSAIDQWADLYTKGMLNCQRDPIDRKAELLTELALLESGAAG